MHSSLAIPCGDVTVSDPGAKGVAGKPQHSRIGHEYKCKTHWVPRELP